MRSKQTQKIKWRAEYKKVTGERSPLTVKGAQSIILEKMGQQKNTLQTYNALKSAKERSGGDASRLVEAIEKANKSLAELKKVRDVLNEVIR